MTTIKVLVKIEGDTHEFHYESVDFMAKEVKAMVRQGIRDYVKDGKDRQIVIFIR